MLKILLTGSVNFSNKRLIKDFLFELHNRHKDNIKVATLNQKYGADKYIRKYAIEFGMNYGEFNRYDYRRGLYDVMPKWLFDKPYHYKNKMYRDSHASKWCDIMILFLEEDYKRNRYNSMIKSVKKNKKIVKIITG